jgi:protocatechuate 4,5-dioxygenase alpha chain
MAKQTNDDEIFGTKFFDGAQAIKGYGLNKMCFSFNEAKNREAFLKDETAYCDKFGLTDAQKSAVKSRIVLDLIDEGGNIYYLAKLTGILGLNMQDIGAQQTGMALEDFNQMLLDQGK